MRSSNHKTDCARPTADTGYAWCVVAAAFVAGFVVFGIVYSFGVLLPPVMTEFHASRAAASAYYAIASLIFYMLGPLSGHIADRFGPHIVTAVGAIAMASGLIATAFIGHLWTGYATYGFGVGLGAGCAYVPTLAILGRWFTRRRNLALGIAAAGTGCGMLVTPPLASILIDSIGWRQTCVILGGASGLLLAACAIAVARLPPAQEQPVSSTSLGAVLRSFEYRIMYLSWVLATMALFVPFVFLPAFSLERGASPLAASALLSILGVASVFGRLGIGVLGGWLGTLKLFKLSVLVMAASYAIWLLLPAYHWLVVFAAVLGLAYGVRIALVTSVLIELFGVKDLGALLGVFFTGTGIAALLAPTFAGALVDYSGHYDWGIAFALLIGAVGFIVILPLGDRQTTTKQTAS
ncbi:MFS transporter [Bradyrhizobium sp. LHD-71]|uniref:MFS transporter n=1 Tax=Bradyrhizobium sp. LHD-71 TaxID=3072141 RepID=UPI00280C7776|nr:MFS transporter [Bradyrhizobium sp. LHD-71]MDQ8726131.1 MFS transporter [Bradyrhizobium sp. LHD-71]